MSYTRRLIAPAVLASCLVAGPMSSPADAQDRGVAPGTTAPVDTDRDTDWGWLGLLGLVGLAGLFRNRRTEHLGARTAAAH